MYGYYTPILILQGFCLYHSYKNNTHQKYMWLIIFVPLLGSLIYLYTTFYSRTNVSNISDSLKGVLNNNYHVEKLEKETKFTDTVANKKNLAQQYINKGRISESIDLLNSCLTGIHAGDQELNRMLLQAYFLQEDYGKCISIGEKITDPIFLKSEEMALLAWAYYYEELVDMAESTFQNQDHRFSNYFQRLEYAKFLVKVGRSSEALDLADLMLEEIDHMDAYERKLKKQHYNSIKSFRRSIAV